MNLTDRPIRLLLAILFGVAAFLPATAVSAEVSQSDPGPIPCEEWMLDEAGKPVCGPAKDDCPPLAATCDLVSCDEPGQCPPPPLVCDPAVEDECPDDTPPETHTDPDPQPARPVVVQPSFTG
jgi:hypothetical protein